MLRYYQNSCYADTLFTILFKSSSNYWHTKIIIEAQNSSDYKPLLCGNNIKTAPEVSAYAERVKEELKVLIRHLLKSETTYCTNIRSIVSGCIPDIRIKDRWQLYSPERVYDLLADLFPSIKIDSTFIGTEGVAHEKIAMFTFWDFMEKNPVKKILWDRLKSEVLVFHNTVLPPIENYGSKVSEIITIGNTKSIIEKDNAFSEIILDKYVLIGVIVLTGYTLGTEGGQHYVCYFRKLDNNFFYYD